MTFDDAGTLCLITWFAIQITPYAVMGPIFMILTLLFMALHIFAGVVNNEY